MVSNEVSTLTMRLVEFSNSKEITFSCQVDDHTKDAPYDIILGSDFMVALGMDIKYSTRTITWDGMETPLKDGGALTNKTICEAIYFANTQSILLQEVEERQQRLLDADYSKVDIEAMVDELDISPGSKSRLKRTLNKFPILFGGGLGLLTIAPVSIELQQGAKPFG